MSRLGLLLGLLLIAGSTSPGVSAQWSPRWRALLADTTGPAAAAKDAAPAPEANELRGNQTEKKTIAQMIDEALEQEFPEEKEDKIGKNYNETAKSSDAKLETVLKVSQNRDEEEEEEPAAKEETAKPGDPKQTPDQKAAADRDKDRKPADKKPSDKKHKHKEQPVETEVDRIIDAQDNEYVLSRPKSGKLGLTLDPQLIRDLTVLIMSSTAVGMVLESLKQPVINGYLIAGSLVGPGGLKLVKELVQVESLAQMGVQLLLFTLGLEFSLSKLKAVRSVALAGGMIQITAFMILAGLLATAIGASVHEGVFIGALVSMSSTSIVVKCLVDNKASNLPHGQITIGTLILQDCVVGLLFAFMPVLKHAPGQDLDQAAVLRLLIKVTIKMVLSVTAAVLLARTLLQSAARTLAKHATDELYQLTVIAFCLVGAWISGYLGLSTELGAFVAGVMLSTTDQQENALHHLEQIKSFFISLFIASTGLVMSPVFLAQHLPILTAGLILVVISKTVVISTVVFLFRYQLRTALSVGLGMAQIGEFAFVLLSSASQHNLIPYQLYMLLMGITGLSLLITPFLLQVTERYLLSDDDGKLFHVRTNGGRHISALDMSIGDGDELLIAHGSPPPDDARLAGRDIRMGRDRALKGRSVDGSPKVSQGPFL